MTIEDLRAQLETLTAEHDAIYRELTPTASPGPTGAMRWSDIDIAVWVGCDVDQLRSWIVQHLSDFAVSDDCVAALLTVPQLVALTLDPTLQAPRIRELDYVSAQLLLVTSRLRELGG
jgi:hypothetical protein